MAMWTGCQITPESSEARIVGTRRQTRGMRRSIRILAVLTVLTIPACATSVDDGSDTTSAAPESAPTADTSPLFDETDDVITAASTDVSTSTTTSSSTSTSTTTSTTSTTTTTTTTLPPGTPASELDLATSTVLLGTSVEGREFVAERHGTPGGRRVLVVGVIHGNEDAGLAVVDELRTTAEGGAIPEGIELWLVPSMNPDGELAQDRHNANEVDLNRNFPFGWGPIGEPGNSQYAGTGPASEPETQAMVAFISQLRPELALWYHQDANLIIPSDGRDGALRARYADLTGLPLAQCCAGGTGIYTGIAATWARNEGLGPNGVAFIVELPGGDLTTEQVTQHTNAVLTVATEL